MQPAHKFNYSANAAMITAEAVTMCVFDAIVVSRLLYAASVRRGYFSLYWTKLSDGVLPVMMSKS